MFEANSKITKKLKEGYFKTKEEAEGTEVIKPMLAEKIGEHEDKITFPCLVQPKLDGVRALKLKDGSFKSRKNTVISTMSHIEPLLKDLGIILDGELYKHGASFQTTFSLIAKETEESKSVKYYIYDCILDKPYKERYETLKLLLKGYLYEGSPIELVPNSIANSMEDIKKLLEYYESKGYEGAMVRWGDDSYKIGGRSTSLLKVKTFIDRAYEIHDIVPADKRTTHGVPVCKLDFTVNLDSKEAKKFSFAKDQNGNIIEVNVGEEKHGIPTVRCGTKLTHEQREEILTNKEKYIGLTAEVRFFEFYDSGVPRFPKFYGIRLDK